MKRPSINWRNERLVLLILILGLAAFLRFYRLANTLDFNGDLGRDALVAKRIIIDHKLTLIGPRASGGVFFLGPFYYYLITPSLLIFNFSPLGPVYLTAFISLLTIILIYWLGCQLFDKETALLSAFVYSVSPLVTRYSRVSGNYTLLPFFSLLAIFFLWRWLQTRKIFDLFLCALCLGLALQLHYSIVALLFFAVLSLIVFRINPWHYKKQFLAAGLIFGFINSPLVLFDLRHGWINLRGLIGYFLSGSGKEIREVVGVEPWSFLGSLDFLGKSLLNSISPIFTVYWGRTAIWAVMVILGIITFLIYKKTFKPPFSFLFLLLLFTLVFASLYRGYVADYYLIAFFPITIILFSNLIIVLSKKRRLLLGIFLTIVSVMTIFNLKNPPLTSCPRAISQLQEAAKIIANDVSAEEKFNLFLKRESPFWSTAAEYRYLVEIKGKRALEPTEYKNSEILYFIAETSVSNPLKVGNWEVEQFQPKEVLKTWELPQGVVIYKLGR